MCIRSLLGGLMAFMLGVAVTAYAQMSAPATIPATHSASRPVTATQINSGLPRYTATSLPARLDITLDPAVMWTQSPPQVQGGCASPDGRAWLQVEVRGGVLSRDGARELIRREYRQKMPQMSLIRPVLFEPGGRVWFRVQSEQGRDEDSEDSAAGALIGYDGKTFIERTDLKEDSRIREWGGAGKLDDPLCVYLDGHAFFSTPGAIRIYDGKDWTSRELPGTTMKGDGGYVGERPALCRLYIEPDGKGVVAVDRDARKPVWRWRDGQWERHATGILDDSDFARSNLSGEVPVPPVRSAAVRRHGLWLLTFNEGLTYIPFDQVEAGSGQPITVAALIGQLGPEETRDFARQELHLHAKAAEPEIRQALAGAQNPELRATLEQILKDLPERSPMSEDPFNRPVPYRSWRVGTYTVAAVQYLVGLPDGGTLIGAKHVVDAAGKPAATLPANPGPTETLMAPRPAAAVLLQEAGGNVRVLGDYKFFFLMRPSSPALRIPSEAPSTGLLAVDNGKRIWTLGDRNLDSPGLLEVATGRIVERIPLPGVASVAAIGDGAFFLTTGQEAGLGSRLVIYRPAGKDTRRLVEPIAQVVSAGSGGSDLPHFTADGCFWFSQFAAGSTTDHVIARYDGKAVDVYPDARIVHDVRTGASSLIPGRDGVLVRASKSWLLVTPRGTRQAATLEDLIAQNAAEVVATFSGPCPVHFSAQLEYVRADSAGNIWLVRRPSGELRVFSAGAWIDASEALKKAGDPRGRATLVVPLGSSPKVLVIDRDAAGAQPANRGKTTFFMSVTDRTIRAEPAPDVDIPRYNVPLSYAPTGDPWVNVARDPQTPRAFSACRMTAGGPADCIDHASVLLGDAAGNVWVSFRPPSAERVEIRMYRDGKFIPPAAPALQGFGPFWAGSGGDLYQASVLGFQVLKTTEREGTLAWDGPETLRFGGVESGWNVLGVSPRGFVVVSSTRSAGQGMPNLFFYRVARR